jgi:hypothetical protein
MQQEWVERHARAERSMNDYTVINSPLGLDIVTAMKKLETIWAKFVEVRTFVHHGITFRNIEDISLKNPGTPTNGQGGTGRLERDAITRRQKKMREHYQVFSFYLVVLSCQIIVSFRFQIIFLSVVIFIPYQHTFSVIIAFFNLLQYLILIIRRRFRIIIQ